MDIVKVKDSIYWAGVKDPDLRIFDIVMKTRWGTTYNSYIIEDDKTALIETVKYRFEQAYMELLEQRIDLAKLDYIILDHTEPDHSGALSDLLEKAQNAIVVCSRAAYQFLKEIVNHDFPHMIVSTGDEINLGHHTLRFISAPNLHWPDSIFTYVPEESVLFSGDVFGFHYCSDAIFNDEIKDDFLPAFEYYYNVIMSPFKKYVLEAVDKIKDLKIDIICPSHGPVLRKDPWSYVDMYRRWSQPAERPNNDKRILIAYVSAYGNTAALAQAIAKGINESPGFDVRLEEIKEDNVADVARDIEEADGVLMGSPTINRDSVEYVWEVLGRVSAITNRNKPAAAFGSYGWSGEAPGLIEDRLKGLGFSIVEPSFKARLVPSNQEISDAVEFGKAYASAFTCLV
jgi:flavorubredoxin